ncbi:MAG: ABC transporter permease subunit [Hydrogeniiclostridium sp.]
MKNKPRLRRGLSLAAAILFWLAVWEAASLAVNLEFLLPSPVRVAERLSVLCREAEFWGAAGGSMLRVLSGFSLAFLAGLAGAVLAFRFPAIEALLRPVLSIVKATPVASFILLALMWIPSPGVPVFTSFLMVFPIVFGNVLSGMQSTDHNLIEMGNMYRLSPLSMFRQIYFPSVVPYLSAACTAGLGLAWKAGVAAEVLANTRLSLGGKIYASKIYFETPDLFAWTAVVIVMSVALEKLVLLLMRRLLTFFHLEAAHADRATPDKKL